MQNIRAIALYLAIVGLLLAAAAAAALMGWTWAAALALWPAENLARAYEALAAHGLIAAVRSGHPFAALVGWDGWWHAGAAWRVEHFAWQRAHAPAHAARVSAVLGGEALVLLRLLTLKPLLGLWTSLWFVMGRVGHLRPGRTYGTARWGSARGLRPWPWWTPLYLGRRRGRWVALPWAQAVLGVLIVGLPGAGKSASLIIPNILRLGGSTLSRILIHLGLVTLPGLVVTDPKGEIYELTAAHLVRLGYDVRRIDLLADGPGPGAADGYNPLAHCRDGHVEDIQRLAEVWVANSGTERAGYSGDTPFWDLTLQELLVAAIAHKNAAARARGAQAATFAEVFAFLRQPPAAIAEELEDSVQAARVSCERFMAHLAKDPRLEGSVFVGAGLRGHVFDIAAARIRTTHDALGGDFRVLGRASHRPIALFVTPTPGRERVLAPLLASLFTQLFDALVDEANHNGTRRKVLTRPVIAWLDEAGTIGQVAGLVDGANRWRSAGLVPIVSIQQVRQLVDTYGERARTLAGALQTHVYFAGVEHDDAKWLAEALGEATVAQEQRTASRQRRHFFTDHGSISRTEARRSLLDADELRRMPRGRAIVEIANRRPVPIRTVPWFHVRGLLPFSRPLARRAGAAAATWSGRDADVGADAGPSASMPLPPRPYNGRMLHVRERPVHAVEWDFEAATPAATSSMRGEGVRR